MSHRDTDHRTDADSNAQELGTVISDLLADVDWTTIRFRQDCGWAPLGLVATALVWTWSPKDSLKERFAQTHRFARGLGEELAP